MNRYFSTEENTGHMNIKVVSKDTLIYLTNVEFLEKVRVAPQVLF